MGDEPEIEVRPIHFTQKTVITVDEWPAWTAVTEDFLRMAHVQHATVEGDTLTFSIGNGTATYRLHRDRPYGQGFLAELVEGDSPSMLKRRAQKFGGG